MNCTKLIPRAVCLLAVLALVALPALGQTTIRKGVDLLETASTGGTQVDFSFTPIPAGFFCPGSPPFTGRVGLKGVPLATAPAGVAGNTDTIIERLADAVFPASGGSVTVPVVVRALGLTSINNIQIPCADGTVTQWRVDACLCACDTGSLQPITSLTLTINQTCGCGLANGSLRLNVCLRFTNVATGQTVGPISQIINLEVKDMPWCPTPGNGDMVLASPFGVDTNCDRRPDLQISGTSNFHPGRTCATQALDCWAQFASLTRCHKNFTNPDAHPHCVNPVCGKRQ